jgi:Ca2+-binding EF-hand superfamily protein
MTKHMIGSLQHKKITRLFHSFDVDKNGFIEASDFSQIANELAAKRGIDADTKERVNFVGMLMMWWEQIRLSADTNNDGRVSFEEFSQFWSGFLANVGVESFSGSSEGLNMLKSSASLTFDILDGDRDGYVTFPEYSDWLTCWKNNVDPREAFLRLDIDNDGKLTRQDIVGLVKDFFLSNDPEASGNSLYGVLS